MTKGLAGDGVRGAAMAAVEELAASCNRLFRCSRRVWQGRPSARARHDLTDPPRRALSPNASGSTTLATRWVSPGRRLHRRRSTDLFVLGTREAEGGPRVGGGQRCRLCASFAYSDSYFDGPLLAAVGNPVAVNPDPRLADARPACAAGPCGTLDVSPGSPRWPDVSRRLAARPSTGPR